MMILFSNIISSILLVYPPLQRSETLVLILFFLPYS
ncbi:unnamed protein product [Amoebophrya sp. A25]|nr:unnamed protein product [Amoebophrya sp. A25]|eukprot:GSA25T00008669001.1